nr:hypothetical protein [Tanacetum cinerariifolium]
MTDSKLARRVSMASLTNSICSGGGTIAGGGDGSGGSGSGDGDIDGSGGGEGDLDLLRDEDGKSDGGGKDDDDGKSDGGEDDDGKSDGGDVRISFPGRRAKTRLVDRGRVGGEWTTDVEAFCEWSDSALSPRSSSDESSPESSGIGYDDKRNEYSGMWCSSRKRCGRDSKLARRVSMSSLTNSICSGGGTIAGGSYGSGGSGSGDGDIDGSDGGEGDLDLLRDEDGKSDGGGEDDDDGKSDGGEDDDGKSDGGDVRISFPGRRAKTRLVDRGRVGGEWTTDVEAFCEWSDLALSPRSSSDESSPESSGIGYDDKRNEYSGMWCSSRKRCGTRYGHSAVTIKGSLRILLSKGLLLEMGYRGRSGG